MLNMKQEDRRYLTLAEFAREVGVTRPTVYTYLDEGLVTSEKFKRFRLIDDRFVELIKNKNYRASVSLVKKIEEERILNENQMKLNI